MLHQEFESLTGVEISSRLFALVHDVYMLNSLTKQAFVSRHFAGCFSEHDIFRCLRALLSDYYPDASAKIWSRLWDLGACRRDGRFDIG